MLRGGRLEPQEITLTAEGEKQARKVAQVLIGTGVGSFFTTDPFQERINVELLGSFVTLKKSNKQPFTYEEVKQVGRPLRAYWMNTAGSSVDDMVMLARKVLEAPFTLFYPSREKPLVELTFLLNRVLIQVNATYTKKLHNSLVDALQKESGGKIKAFSNHYNALSLHHDSMDGLFLSHKVLSAFGHALVENHLMPEAAIDDLAVKASMMGLKCTAFLEARQLCMEADKTYEAGDIVGGNILDQNHMKSILAILAALSKQGSFADLNAEQLEFLFQFLRNPKRIDAFDSTDAIKTLLRSLTKHYPEEICQCSSQVGNFINMDPKNTLLGNPGQQN